MDARDPLVLAAMVSTLVATGLLAIFIPARRVAKMDPATSLAAQ